MLYAIISDLHSHGAAWRAFAAEIGAKKISKVVSLGDLVGIGEDTDEIFAEAPFKISAFVIGEHDAAFQGAAEKENFLRRQALRLEVGVSGKGGFTCVHASPAAAADFSGIETLDDAKAAFAAEKDAQIIFVGHTHTQKLFAAAADNVAEVPSAAEIPIRQGLRYIVNPGALANGNYCLYDSSANTISFQKLAGVETSLPENALSEVGVTKENLARATSSLAAPQVLPARPRNPATGKRILFTFLAVFGLVAGSLAAHFTKGTKQDSAPTSTSTVMQLGKKSFPAEPLAPNVARSENDFMLGNLLPQMPKGRAADGTFPQWRFTLSSTSKQNVGIGNDGSKRPYISVRSGGKNYFKLEVPEWQMNGFANGRLQAAIYTKVNPQTGFNGEVAINVWIEEQQDDGTTKWRNPIRKTLNIDPNGTWTLSSVRMASDDTSFGPNAIRLRWELEGEFEGSLDLAEIKLMHLRR